MMIPLWRVDSGTLCTELNSHVPVRVRKKSPRRIRRGELRSAWEQLLGGAFASQQYERCPAARRLHLQQYAAGQRRLFKLSAGFGRRGHGLMLDLGDERAAADAGLAGDAAWINVGNHDAGRAAAKAKILRHLRRQVRDGHADLVET